MTIELLTQISQLGATGFLAVVLYFLWQEFKEQNKFIREQLLESQAEREVIAKNIGMTTQELKHETMVVRARMDTERKAG